MNFISHFRGAMDRLAGDSHRLTAHHVAMYYALFYYWNLSRFRIPMPVARDDIMKLARIGSKKTYHRCIQELDAWGYLQYEPTHDNQSRTTVHMYRFDKGSGTTSDTTSGTTDGTTSDTASETTGVPEVGQSLLNSIINDINGLNDKNELNASNDYGTANKNSIHIDHREQPAQKAGAGDLQQERENSSRGDGAAVPGSLEEVKAWFAEQKFSLQQAEKFYNYYGSIGWTVGKSRQPMHNWRLAAKNWISNAKRFNDEQPLKPGDLHVPKGRNYKQPL